MHKRLLALTSALVLSANLSAQETPPAPAPEKKPTPKESKAEKDGRDPETKPRESKGSIKIEGKTVAYTAKTGILPVYK